MKRLLLATTVLFGSTLPLLAADLAAQPYTKAQPSYVASPIYNWTGFYIGGHIGGDFPGANNLITDDRFLGGVEVGADYQFMSNFVVGIEAQYSWLFGSTTANGGGLTSIPGLVINSGSNQLGSVTGRLGFTMGPSLFYAKAGYAFKDNGAITGTYNGTPIPAALLATNGFSNSGYTVGGGIEYMFAPSWSAKLEYMYYNFGSGTFTNVPIGFPGSGTFTDTEQTLKLGVNYRFSLR